MILLVPLPAKSRKEKIHKFCLSQLFCFPFVKVALFFSVVRKTCKTNIFRGKRLKRSIMQRIPREILMQKVVLT